MFPLFAEFDTYFAQVLETHLQQSNAVLAFDAGFCELCVEILLVRMHLCLWWMLKRWNHNSRGLER